jgi:hypothetical protein
MSKAVTTATTNAVLNYQALSHLPAGLVLDVCDVDVQRLRDDRSEIMLGDEVAFVAVAKFRIPLGAGSLNVPLWDNLGPGDEVFWIGNDAELRSDKFQLDEDGVIDWIRQTFSFTFTLNGETSTAFQPVGRTSVAPATAPAVPDGTVTPGPKSARIALPWLTKLNTVLVKDDYIDVDVKIGTPSSPTPPVSKQNSLWFSAQGMFGPPSGQAAPVELQLEIDDLEKLPADVYSIPLVSEETGARLRMNLRFSQPADQESASRHSHDLTSTKTKPRNR